MTILKITEKQLLQAYGLSRNPIMDLDIVNKAIEIALAEQQETYITAAQARELGSGNAEYSINEVDWYTCKVTCKYRTNAVFSCRTYKYRAIKQSQPEPVDPHAALRAEYAKQVKEGTTGFYLWEVDWEEKPTGFTSCYQAPEFNLMRRYRCTDISCVVSKDGEPAKRMLRSEAQELFAETKKTHDWYLGKMSLPWEGEVFCFDADVNYTYRTKATVKLDGKMVTPEQAKDEWEAKKETHDVYLKNVFNTFVCVNNDNPHEIFSIDGQSEYEFRLKPLKQVSWSDMPVGVAVTYRGQTYPLHRSPVMGFPCVITTDGLICQDFSNSSFGLAPASEQPWIAVQDGEDGFELTEGLYVKGFMTELYMGEQKYRVVGIATGWELK
jgi:hypothetical protein